MSETGEQKGLRIEVSEAKKWDRRCALCGEYFEMPVALALYDDAEPGAGRQFIGFVCSLCAQFGADGARARARGRAANLRELADIHERLASRLPDDAQWPSEDEIERRMAELELERRAGVTVAAIDEDDVPF